MCSETFSIMRVPLERRKNAMGLLPVDCFMRSTRNNYNLTYKLQSLRKTSCYLPYFTIKIDFKTILNTLLSWQNTVELKACGVLPQVLLTNDLNHNRGYLKNELIKWIIK